MLTLNRERTSERESYDTREDYGYQRSSYAPREVRYEERTQPDERRYDDLWRKLEYTSPTRVSYGTNVSGGESNNAYYSVRAEKNQSEYYDEPTKNVRRAEREAKSRAKGKMSTQGKVILAIYLILAVAVASLIIVNAGVLNGEDVTAVNAPEATVEVSEASGELNVTVEQSPYQYEQTTNWFDKLCDGISGLFGD